MDCTGSRFKFSTFFFFFFLNNNSFFLFFGLNFLCFPLSIQCPKSEVKNTLQVIRDPRWGRCYESYSEDTEVVRKMSCLVTGLQGQPPEEHPHGYPFLAGR